MADVPQTAQAASDQFAKTLFLLLIAGSVAFLAAIFIFALA